MWESLCSAVFCFLFELLQIAKAHPASSKDLVPSFVSILKHRTQHPKRAVLSSQCLFFRESHRLSAQLCFYGLSGFRQITEHRLPRDFDYHRMPAPWLQVHTSCSALEPRRVITSD